MRFPRFIVPLHHSSRAAETRTNPSAFGGNAIPAILTVTDNYLFVIYLIDIKRLMADMSHFGRD